VFYRITGCLVALSLSIASMSVEAIDLDTFLDLAQERHPFFRKESITPDIEKQQLERFVGDEDWILRSTPSYSHFESVSQGLSIPEEEDVAGIETSLERILWRTGGRISVSHRYDFSDQKLEDLRVSTPAGNLTLPVGPSRFHEQGLFLSYTQPILRNTGGVLDRLDYDVQGFTVEIQTLVVQENQENFLRDLAERFLDWVLLTEQRQITRNRLQLASKELNQVRRKFKAGLVDKVDVFRAQDAVLSSKATLSRFEAAFNAKRTELAALINDPTLQQKQPDMDPYQVVKLPAKENVVTQMKDNARILRALRLQAEQQGALRDGLKDTARAQLDFSVSVGIKDGDEAFSSSNGFDKTDSQLALDFSYPLGNRTAKADVRKAILQRQQTLVDVQNEIVNLEAAVHNALTQIQGLKNTLELNRQRIKTARARTRAEEDRYNLGRAELTFVIQSRDAEAVAQLAYANNAINYHKLLLEYRSLTDSLLPVP
jgi:outer membrane protein TolC